MTLRVTENQFGLIRDLIANRSGIFLGVEKQYLIENRLSPLVESSQCPDFGEFYLKIKDTPVSGKLWGAVIDAMTTNETSWLRDQHPFVTMKDILIPKFQQEILSGKRHRVDIWSAACSTGEEPYSIAMTALDSCQTEEEEKAFLKTVRILATDISSAALSTAKEGRYTSAAVGRGLPLPYRERYFEEKDGFWSVDGKIKNLVTFKQFNLQDSFLSFGPFDIVFMRNVIIYFSDAFKKELFGRMARVISPGGHMFLGTGETVRGYAESFKVAENNGAAYYQVVS